MSILKFRRGTLAQLDKRDSDGKLLNFEEGSINFTTDVPGIYIDIIEQGQEGSKEVRKRIGDLIEVNNYSELLQLGNDNAFESADYNNQTIASIKKIPSWNETALYYVKESNALLKYIPSNSNDDNGHWVRVNVDADQLAIRLAGIDELIYDLKDPTNDAPNVPSLYGIYNKIIGGYEEAPTFETEKTLTNTYNKLIGSNRDFSGVELTKDSFIDNSIKEAQSAIIHVRSEMLGQGEALIGDEDALPITEVSFSEFYKYLKDGTNMIPADGKVTNFPQMITKMEQTIAAADAMTFMGILDKDHLVASYYNGDRKWHAGDTFKVAQLGGLKSSITNGPLDTYETLTESQIETYTGEQVFIGDLVIVKNDYVNSDSKIELWHISSGLEDQNEAIFKKSEDTTKTNTVVLGSPVGLNYGSITIAPADNKDNIKISLKVDDQKLGFGQQLNYTASLEWAEF